jgi:hypothetical protein
MWVKLKSTQTKKCIQVSKPGFPIDVGRLNLKEAQGMKTIKM